MTKRLVDEGFISFEQAELAEGTDGTQSPARLSEVLGYFGAVAVFIATIALMVEVAFDPGVFPFGGIDNVPGGLVTLVGAAVLGWGGYRFTRSSEAAVQRSGGFVLASAFGLWVVTVALLLQDVDANDATPLILALPVVVAAWYLWNRFRSVPTQLVAFVAVTQIVNALLVLFQITDYASPEEILFSTAFSGSPPGPEWFATFVAVAVGLGWVWFTREGLITPRNSGFAIGSLYAGFNGIVLFSSADGWVVLFAAITLVFVYGGLTWRSSVLLGIGTFHLIVFVVMLISIFQDGPGAVSIALWFGIPGLAALAYAMWSEDQRGTAAAPAATSAPEPPAAPPPTETPPPAFPPPSEDE